MDAMTMEPRLHVVEDSDSAESELPATWDEANRRYLAAEVRRLLSRLASLAGEVSGSGAEAQQDEDLAGARDALPTPSALDCLQQRFGLSAFERNVIVACAAFALDPTLALRYEPVTFALVQALAMPPEHARAAVALGEVPRAFWEALSPRSPLHWHRLIRMARGETSLWSPLRIDERVLRYVLGIPGIDARLEGVLRAMPAAPELLGTHDSIAAAIASTWRACSITHPMIELWGSDGQTRRAVAAAACQRLGWRLYELQVDVLPSELGEIDLARLASREALLAPAALFLDADRVEAGDPVAQARLGRMAHMIEGPLVLASQERRRRGTRPAVAIEISRPAASEQRQAYSAALSAEGLTLGDDVLVLVGVEQVAAQFDLGLHDIRDACAMARRRVAGAAGAGVGTAGAPVADATLTDALWDACRDLSRPQFGGLAQRSRAHVTWSDLVLAEPQLRALREIVVRVRQRGRVHDTWGFGARGARGLGGAALFSGHSGTGQTLAAEVLANELRLDLYRIDLSQVVSKYIGETERNLGRVFDAAESGSAVLLFDEADALFAKRSEVKDSHDRYANIEVGYLLQRMEAYRGLAILTTNLQSSLDPAFQRRIAFIVEFNHPDDVMRRSIWRMMFPPQMPTDHLDFDRLAALPMSGGSIRNVALSAAFLAAEAGVPIAMAHIATAAKAEYLKLHRTAPAALGLL